MPRSSAPLDSTLAARRTWRWSAAAALFAATSCGGPQSTLEVAGRDAERIAGLFWWMAGGGALIWIAVVGLSVHAILQRRGEHRARSARLLIVGGGAVFPTITLLVLLVFGLRALPELLALPPAGGMRIEVTGETWWWRVRYVLPDGRELELANELHLPVGERVRLALRSDDVIHSFWVPSIAGKMDMVPGRVTELALEPTRTGLFRGACAEYCGSAHALMSFYVVVEERADFERWLERQAGPADAPRSALARRGEALFLETGCGACHAVRGTPADGAVGPDLTHVGGRASLGAGILPNEAPSFARWVARAERVKPGVRMPAFHMLPGEELAAIAAYLEGLE